MVQSGYKFRTGLASNYIVYRGLQINYFRIQKKGPFLSECVEICCKIKSFSQKQQTLSDKFNRNVIRPAFRRRPDRVCTTGPGVIRRRTGTSASFPTRLPGRSFPQQPRYVFPTRPGKSQYPPCSPTGRRHATTKYGNVSCDTLPYSRDSPTEPFMSLIIFPGSPQRHAYGSVSIRRRTPLPLFPSEQIVASIRLHDNRKRHCPDRRGLERRLSGLRPSRYILNEMPPTKLTSSVAGFQIRLVKNPSFIPSAPLISQFLPAFRKTF